MAASEAWEARIGNAWSITVAMLPLQRLQGHPFRRTPDHGANEALDRNLSDTRTSKCWNRTKPSRTRFRSSLSNAVQVRASPAMLRCAEKWKCGAKATSDLPDPVGESRLTFLRENPDPFR